MRIGLISVTLLAASDAIRHSRFHVAARDRSRCRVLGCSVPSSVEEMAEAARAAVMSAIVSGQREMTVEAEIVQENDEAFVHLALRCMRALTVLSGHLVLMLPNLKTLAAAEETVSADWPVADRRRLRLGILEYCEPVERAAGVMVAGCSDYDRDSPAHRNACAWLRASTQASVCLNFPAVGLLKFERARFETVFAFEPHHVTREVHRFSAAGRRDAVSHLAERHYVTPQASTPPEGGEEPASAARPNVLGGELPVVTEMLGKAMLYRAHPEPWQVMLALGGASEYERLAQLPARPHARDLHEIVEPQVRARRAALGAALRALRSNVTAEGAGEGSAGRPAAQFRPLSVAGAVGVASQGSGGVVLCLSWSDIEAHGAAEALSFYQAVALLRQRCHGSATSFANDDKGLHVILPYSAEEAADARARSQAGGRLNGDLCGSCLLVPDGAARGVAWLEQLSLQRDVTPEQRAEWSAMLITRALREARALGQRWAISPVLPPLLRVEGARWLEAAGFGAAAESGAPAEVVELVPPGAMIRAV